MKFLIALVVLISTQANAYIPPSDYLFTKLAKTHGKGFYSLEQEVVFRNETETLVVKESWMIADGDTMKLSVRASSLNLDFVFNDGKVYFAENAGSVSSRKLSSESLERLFHIRNEKTLADLFVATKIVAQNPMRARPRPRDPKLIKPEVDPYVRLTKLGEEPAILVSSTQDANNSATVPGVWLDPELFTIRKIRFPSQAEVQATNYQSLSNDLVASRLRTVTWGQNSAEIRLIKSNSLPKTKDTEVEFSSSTIANSPLNWGNSSLVSVMREFYQRFR